MHGKPLDMNSESKKICPCCYEEIRQQAKVCPHCQQWVAPFSIRNPAVGFAIMTICLCGLGAAFLVMLGRMVNPGVDFSQYRDGVAVVESHMSLISKGEYYRWPAVAIVGVLTNRTELAWKNVEMDVLFYDKMGGMIGCRAFGYGDIILSHGQLGFQTTVAAIHPLEDYSAYKIFVRSATDARCILRN